MKKNNMSQQQFISLLRETSLSSNDVNKSKKSVTDNVYKHLHIKKTNMNKFTKWFQQHKKISLSTAFILLFTLASISTYIISIPSPLLVNKNSNAQTNNSELVKFAQKQFQTLNSGLKYDEVQSYILASSDMQNYDKYKKEITDSGNNDTSITYSESQLTILDPDKFGLITSPNVPPSFGKIPGVDYSKPLLIKNWYNINYAKYIVSQGNKIINYIVVTPEYNMTYAGGAYGILTKYSQPKYLSGNSVYNWHIEIVNAILNPKYKDTFKYLGKQNVDSKTLDVYENSFYGGYFAPSSQDSSKAPTIDGLIGTKYYVDFQGNNIYKTEDYIDNNLVKSEITGKTEKISPEKNNPNNTVNYLDLKNIPVRATVDLSTADESDMRPNVLKCAQSFDLLYLVNDSTTPTVAECHPYDTPSSNQPNFNPIPSNEIMPIADYFLGTQTETSPKEIHYDLHGKVTSESPEKVTSIINSHYFAMVYDRKPTIQSDYKLKVVRTNSITILVNGVGVSAQYYVKNGEPRAADTDSNGSQVSENPGSTTYEIVFQIPGKNLWYDIYENADYKVSANYLVESNLQFRTFKVK